MRHGTDSTAALFAHPVFCEACKDLEALGFSISDAPSAGTRPYAVIAGRSNARWWLIPLDERCATASGLALFQPTLRSAHLLKQAAMVTAAVGLSGLWGREQVHVGGQTSLSDIFRDGGLRYAFFTGTDSPHRKTAVQVMDATGRIKGFAKVTRDPGIALLLEHEARVLERLAGLELRTAVVPAFLYAGKIGGASLLATDTRKTKASRVVVDLTEAHVAFLREIGERTAADEGTSSDWVATVLSARRADVAARLTSMWRSRLDRAIERVAGYRDDSDVRHLSHGDYTPSNTFFTDESLYVFDWEYASTEHPPAFDLVHFVLSSPATRRNGTVAAIAHARGRVQEAFPWCTRAGIDRLLVAYLCANALRFAAREHHREPLETWPGEPETAAMLDAMMAAR